MLRVLKNRSFRSLMTLVIVSTILTLGLPCDCFADKTSTPSSSESPCHSSQETSDSHNEKSHDSNCCCVVSTNYFSIDNFLFSTAYKKFDSSIDLLAHKSVANIFTAPLNVVRTIRGSPPTGGSFFTSTITFLSILQRWLF